MIQSGASEMQVSLLPVVRKFRLARPSPPATVTQILKGRRDGSRLGSTLTGVCNHAVLTDTPSKPASGTIPKVLLGCLRACHAFQSTPICRVSTRRPVPVVAAAGAGFYLDAKRHSKSFYRVYGILSSSALCSSVGRSAFYSLCRFQAPVSRLFPTFSSISRAIQLNALYHQY